MTLTATIAERVQALIEQLQSNGSLTQAVVAGAFRAVPRHHFLPALPLDEAYRDDAIPTKFSPDGSHPISSSSQPSMMAIMLEQLAVRPGQRILEIGAGTGYNAALLAHLVGPSGAVVTLDLDEDIVEAARAHLAAAGVTNVQVICTDGALGYPPAAPYDHIILTVGAWDIAPAWYEQLKPGGRLVLPLEIAPGTQKSAALVKLAAPAADGRLFDTKSLRDCGFMRLRGSLAGPEQHFPLGPEPGLTLIAGQTPAAAPEALYAWLLAGGHATTTGLTATPEQIWSSLGLWLGLNALEACTLLAGQGQAERGVIPCLFDFPGPNNQRSCLSPGLLTASGCGVLGRGPGIPYPQADAAAAPFELYLWSYGPDSAAAARLGRLLADWQAAGRPGSAGLLLSVYDRAAPLPPLAPHTVVVEKPATRLLLTFAPPAGKPVS